MSSESFPVLENGVKDESQRVEHFKQKFLDAPYGNLKEEHQAMLRTHIENSKGKWSSGEVTDVRWDDEKKRIVVEDSSGVMFYYDAYTPKPEKSAVVPTPLHGDNTGDTRITSSAPQEFFTVGASEFIATFDADFSKGVEVFQKYVETSDEYAVIKIPTIIQTLFKVLDKFQHHQKEFGDIVTAIRDYYHKNIKSGSIPVLYMEPMDRALEIWYKTFSLNKETPQ